MSRAFVADKVEASDGCGAEVSITILLDEGGELGGLVQGSGEDDKAGMGYLAWALLLWSGEEGLGAQFFAEGLAQALQAIAEGPALGEYTDGCSGQALIADIEGHMLAGYLLQDGAVTLDTGVVRRDRGAIEFEGAHCGVYGCGRVEKLLRTAELHQLLRDAL